MTGLVWLQNHTSKIGIWTTERGQRANVESWKREMEKEWSCKATGPAMMVYMDRILGGRHGPGFDLPSNQRSSSSDSHLHLSFLSLAAANHEGSVAGEGLWFRSRDGKVDIQPFGVGCGLSLQGMGFDWYIHSRLPSFPALAR